MGNDDFDDDDANDNVLPIDPLLDAVRSENERIRDKIVSFAEEAIKPLVSTFDQVEILDAVSDLLLDISNKKR